MKFHKISHQILVVFVSVVVVSLGLSSWLVTSLAQNIVTDSIARGHRQLARRVADEIDTAMRDIKPVLRLLAGSSVLESMEAAAAGREITRYQESFPMMARAYVADATGQQIARTDGERLENVASLLGFQVAEQGYELVSDIYASPSTGEPTLTMYLPITTEGKVIGVLSADLDFGLVHDIVASLELEKNETVVVVAENGRAVAHSQTEELGDRRDLSDLAVIQAVVGGQEGVMRGYTDELGRRVLGVYAPVKEIGWGVVIQTPEGDLAAEVATLRQSMAIGLLGSVIVAAIAGWLMARQLAKPIGQLARATERVAAGDLAPTIVVRASNEVGVLAISFNRMVASLKESRDKIEQLYADVKELNVGLERRVHLATEEIRQRADELAVLYEVNRGLATAFDLEILLPTIAQRLADTLPANRCAVFLFDEEAGVLRAQAAYGYMAERLADTIYRPGEEIVGEAYATAEPRYVPDLDLVPDLPRRDAIRSVLAVPLVSPTTGPLGVLSLASLRPEAFTAQDGKTLVTIANQAAMAIENARLYQKTEQHATQLAALYEVGKEIITTLKLDTVLQTIADAAIRVVGADKSLILLIDTEKERLTRVFGHGYSQAQLEEQSFEAIQEGISGWVLQRKVPTRSADIQTDERNRGKALANARKSDDRSAAVAPLIIRGQVIGTLTMVNSRQGRVFAPADLNLVTMLAGQATITIHNARLYEAAQEADRLKSAFLATMSHELRTPLNSIIGFTGIMLQDLAGPLNDEQAKQLGMVQSSARHLLNLINDVLDISKIEAGQLEIVSEPFDMREAIGKVARTLTPMVKKSGLALLTQIASEVGQIVSDQRRVEQILMNLIGNAVKFTDKGQVRVECGVSDDWLVTRVVDTGIGIKPEDMGKIFEAFRQAETGLSRQYEGTGLGLSICRKLVEMLGGEIWVESEWGVGSTFTFMLPVAGGDAEAARRTQST